MLVRLQKTKRCYVHALSLIAFTIAIRSFEHVSLMISVKQVIVRVQQYSRKYRKAQRRFTARLTPTTGITKSHCKRSSSISAFIVLLAKIFSVVSI